MPENELKVTVKYQNRLNLVPLKHFNAKEMDLFFALCSRMKDKGIKPIEFTFEELRELSSYKMTATSAFVGDLEQMYNNMLKLSYRTEDENVIRHFVLFPGFEIDKKKKVVSVSVNPTLSDVLNGLTSEFSKFELSAFTSIRSTYAKTLFRLLMQYRKTRMYVTTIDNFRELLDIPENYQMGNIDQRVLQPAMKELEAYFEELEVEKIKERKRNKIARLKFTFKGLKTDLPQVTLHNWLDEDGGAQ